jgi:hypothetical protein
MGLGLGFERREALVLEPRKGQTWIPLTSFWEPNCLLVASPSGLDSSVVGT